MALTLTFAGQTNGPGDGVTAAQAPAAHVAQCHIDIVGARQVARGAHEGVIFLNVKNAGNRREVVLTAASRTRLVACLAILTCLCAGVAVAARTPPTLAAGAASLSVVTVGQLNVKNGFDDTRLWLRGRFRAISGRQRQVERYVCGFDGTLADCAAAARTAWTLGGGRSLG